MHRLRTITGYDCVARAVGYVWGYSQDVCPSCLARGPWGVSEGRGAAAVVKSAHLRSRGYVLFQGVTLVCRVLSPIIVVTRAVVTWAVASLVTLAAAEGVLLSPTPHS